jgi:MFS family permease
VVSTAIRTIADDLNGFSLQAWATTAFLITSTISTPLYGKLSDIYGRKPFFLFAISIFIAARRCAACPARCTSWPRSGRSRASAPAACSRWRWRSSATSCRPRQRARYQGYFLAVFGTSSVLGPVLGGLFAGANTHPRRLRLAVDLLHQRADRAGRAGRGQPGAAHPAHRRDHRIDWQGAVALIIGLVPLLIVAEQGRELGLGVRPQRGLLLHRRRRAVLFYLAERMCKDDALIPLRLFRGGPSRGRVSSVIIGHGHVRRDPRAAALPADRQGLLADQAGLDPVRWCSASWPAR